MLQKEGQAVLHVHQQSTQKSEGRIGHHIFGEQRHTYWSPPEEKSEAQETKKLTQNCKHSKASQNNNKSVHQNMGVESSYFQFLMIN